MIQIENLDVQGKMRAGDAEKGYWEGALVMNSKG